jgi:hypothetical protein
MPGEVLFVVALIDALFGGDANQLLGSVTSDYVFDVIHVVVSLPLPQVLTTPQGAAWLLRLRILAATHSAWSDNNNKNERCCVGCTHGAQAMVTIAFKIPAGCLDGSCSGGPGSGACLPLVSVLPSVFVMVAMGLELELMKQFWLNTGEQLPGSPVATREPGVLACLLARLARLARLVFVMLKNPVGRPSVGAVVIRARSRVTRVAPGWVWLYSRRWNASRVCVVGGSHTSTTKRTPRPRSIGVTNR